MPSAALLCSALLAVGCTCSGGGPRTAIPDYTAERAAAPPTIDGRLDDPIWQEAARTEPFVWTMTGEPGEPTTTAQIAWDDDALYVAFDVADGFIAQTLSGHDAHLWEQDTVEIMVDPNGDGVDYYEMQLSPTDEVFDTSYASRRVPQPFGRVHWDSELRGACQVRGAANDDEDDEGYTAELAIPWGAFEDAATSGQAPSPGDTWRVALYVLDKQRDGFRAVGWSPPLVGDFHVPERFGRVTFSAD